MWLKIAGGSKDGSVENIFVYISLRTIRAIVKLTALHTVTTEIRKFGALLPHFSNHFQ